MACGPKRQTAVQESGQAGLHSLLPNDGNVALLRKLMAGPPGRAAMGAGLGSRSHRRQRSGRRAVRRRPNREIEALSGSKILFGGGLCAP